MGQSWAGQAGQGRDLRSQEPNAMLVPWSGHWSKGKVHRLPLEFTSFPGYDLLMPKHSEDVSIYMTELWLIEETRKMTNAMVFPGESPLRDTTMHSHIGRNF